MWGKLIIRLAILGLVLFLINLAVIPMLPAGWGNTAFYNKTRYLEDSTSGVNTLFIGSSMIFRHLDPEVFDSVTANKGIKSFNLGSAALRFVESVHLYDWFLDSYDKIDEVDYVIFGLSEIQTQPERRNIHTKSFKYWYNWKDTRMVIRALWNEEGGWKGKMKNTAIHLMVQMEKWTNLGIGLDFIELFINEQNWYRLGPDRNGFYSLETEYKEARDSSIIDRFDYFQARPEMVDSVRKLSLEYYKNAMAQPDMSPKAYDELITDIIAKSKEKGIRLIFLMTPRQAQFYEQVVPIYLKLPEENRIEIADPEVYPEFYLVEHSFDFTHFDDWGARRMTLLTAEKFKKLID